jgi:hypothetical protein
MKDETPRKVGLNEMFQIDYCVQVIHEVTSIVRGILLCSIQLIHRPLPPFFFFPEALSSPELNASPLETLRVRAPAPAPAK